ncbi:MAG: thioredoxin domain-containing protein [Bryobacterales bacterium]|nr:thioredoxin domain-containing protein [Bryobacterales bacterium]
MEISRLVEGHPQAVVRLEFFEDLACSDCAYLRRKLDEVLLPRYGSRVAFVHYDFPLAKHVWARDAAVAARWMEREQGAATAVRFRRAVLAYLREIEPGGFRDWTDRFLEMAEIAGPVDWDDAALHALVDADLADGLRREVVKTPTVFLGAVTFIEYVPMPELLAALDEALGKAMEVSA